MNKTLSNETPSNETPSNKTLSNEAPSMNETELLFKFIAEVPRHLPHVRVFRRNIVNALVQKNGRHFHARAGIKGQADAYALVRGGRTVEIETKAAKGKLRDEQKAWRSFCIEFAIPYLELRAKAGEHPDETVTRWMVALREVTR